MLSAHLNKVSNGFHLDVEFSLRNGITGIVGPSGSGKTLTLKSLAGFIDLDDGYIFQKDITFFNKKKRINLKTRYRNIGYVFQDYALFPHLTVRQNIEYGIDHLPNNEKSDLAQSFIEKMQLTGLDNRYPSELSGGQQQRTALARTLVTNPSLLLLDEPFSALDPTLRETLATELITLVQEHFDGVTLFVTHHLEDAYRLCDELLVYHNGKIVEQGETKELFHSPKRVETAKWLGIENIFPIRDFPTDRIQPHEGDYWAIRGEDIILDNPEHLSSKPYLQAELVEYIERINFIQLKLQVHQLIFQVKMDKEQALPILNRAIHPFIYLDPKKILYLNN